MASYARKKTAIRGALYAFIAGAHCVTEYVDTMHGLVYGGIDSDAGETRTASREMLLENWERFLNTPDAAIALAETLNQEEVYPFLNKWNGEILVQVFSKMTAPDLSFVESDSAIDPDDGEYFEDSDGEQFWVEEEQNESDCLLKFKAGYKKLLSAAAESMESTKSRPESVDHWMLLLLNTAFLAGMNAAAQMAENPQAYFTAIEEIEGQEETWAKYPQISSMFENQLKRETRRKTGLVEDLES